MEFVNMHGRKLMVQQIVNEVPSHIEWKPKFV
jgi:hypothetical protein